jgi:lysophospholipase L1-like esterase
MTDSQPTKRPRWQLGLLLSLVSLLFSLLLMEVAVRVFFFEHVDTDALTAQLAATSVSESIQPSTDPNIHFELRPGLDIEFQGERLVTSAEGIRVAPGSPTAAQGALRVAVIGDSTSFGWRVAYADSYPAYFAVDLETRLGRPIDLRNYSVSGYNTEQSVHTYLQKVAAFEPDLLIVHYAQNDADPAQFSSYVHPEYGDNVLGSALIKFLVRQAKLVELKRDHDNRLADHTFISNFISTGPLKDRQNAAFELLGQQTAAMNVPVLVVIFNPFVEQDAGYQDNEVYTGLHLPALSHLTEQGFFVLDLYPAYQDVLAEMDWQYADAWWVSAEAPTDAHPNSIGHRFIADQMLQYLEATPALLQALTGE